MPNGFYGTKEQWDAAEKPLTQLDPLLKRFAEEHYMFSEANSRRKNWPMRSFSWGSPIERGIVLQLDSQTPPDYTYELYVYAYLDDLGRKSRRREVIFKGLRASEFASQALAYLQQARELVAGWQQSDLELISESGY